MGVIHGKSQKSRHVEMACILLNIYVRYLFDCLHAKKLYIMPHLNKETFFFFNNLIILDVFKKGTFLVWTWVSFGSV